MHCHSLHEDKYSSLVLMDTTNRRDNMYFSCFYATSSGGSHSSPKFCIKRVQLRQHHFKEEANKGTMRARVTEKSMEISEHNEESHYCHVIRVVN